jgi:hypothetical protein
MTTLCRDCDLVHSDTRKLAPSRWACLACPVKLEALYPALDPDWHPNPPYALCRHIRTPMVSGTDCADFTPRRTGKDKP